MFFYDMLVPLIKGLAIAAGMAAPEFETDSHDGRMIIILSLYRSFP
jgi:hypothetical protein